MTDYQASWPIIEAREEQEQHEERQIENESKNRHLASRCSPIQAHTATGGGKEEVQPAAV
jgi:hypothetical protein